jgi:glucose-6-phosphate dehydrogenase assembly protein OpcA
VTTTARALTGPLVVVAPAERLPPAADALAKIGEAVGLRSILISQGEHAAPPAKVDGDTTYIAGLAPRFLNNAVAALRLSSLPALVWWRGGSIEALEDLAHLADRVVLDVEAPEAAWQRAETIFERTALTDIRWTRLTRWRSALAHIFDLPQVRDAADAFARLTIDAVDPDAGRLFAGWLRSRLHWKPSVSISITRVPGSGSSPLSKVALEGPNVWIAMEVRQESRCLAARVDGVDGSARIVPLSDGSLATLIAEELGVRSRDWAFEEALVAGREIHP